MSMLGFAKRGLKVVFSRVKYKIMQGCFLRPVLRKFFSPKKTGSRRYEQQVCLLGLGNCGSC